MLVHCDGFGLTDPTLDKGTVEGMKQGWICPNRFYAYLYVGLGNDDKYTVGLCVDPKYEV